MASLCNDRNGRRRIQFANPNGGRHTIRLGKIPKRAAEAFQVRIETLLAAQLSKSPIDADTAQWVASLPDKMAKRLVAVGLIAPREREVATPLNEFLDAFLKWKQRAKPATKEIWQQPIRNLKAFFGDTRDISTITEEEAEEFKNYLLDSGLASTTVSKRLQFTRGFFKFAVKRKLITQNPFEDVSEVAVGLPNTKRFITLDDTAALLEVADITWRVIIALGRYGGLRCPSEVASLRWEDIDWEKGWMTVTSPKTEHHKGRETRLVPLFPQLEAVLREAFEAAPDGATYVIGARLREKALQPRGWRACSLRPQFMRLIKRAGLKPWPRPFHNLRASRETELMHQHPIHVVTAWLGNSPQVAMKHYCMVTDEDFRKARQGRPDIDPNGGPESGANSDARVAQNAAQHPHAALRNGSHDSHATPSPDATSATPGETLRNPAKSQNGGHGIRKLTKSSVRTGVVYQGGAESDASGDTRVLTALGASPEAWNLLPVSIRQTIAALPVEVLEALRTLLQLPPCPSGGETEPLAPHRASHL